jgi:hypothetical protein
VLFCLVVLCMAAIGPVVLVLLMLCAGFGVVTNVSLLGLWAVRGTTRRIVMWGCAMILTLDGTFGFTSWIVVVLRRGEIRDPLDSLGQVMLGRPNVIAAGFACWVLLLICQVLPPPAPTPIDVDCVPVTAGAEWDRVREAGTCLAGS